MYVDTMVSNEESSAMKMSLCNCYNWNTLMIVQRAVDEATDAEHAGTLHPGLSVKDIELQVLPP